MRAASAVLITAGRLRRVLRVDVAEGSFVLEYQGAGLGWEAVFIDGEVVASQGDSLWFTPHFDFELDAHSAVVEVRVGPTLRIRSFALRIDGDLCYSDTGAPPELSISTALPIPQAQLPGRILDGRALLCMVVVSALTAAAAEVVRRLL